MGQERLGPSYFFIPLVLGPLNSLVWYVPSLRYTRGLGWHMHCGAEVTESSTNKQHHLSLSVTCLKHLILIVRLPLTLMLLTSSLLSRILTLSLIRLKSFSMLFVGSVQGLFSCFSFSLRSLPVSHVEGSSLTTSLRYQDLRSCVLFFVIS